MPAFSATSCHVHGLASGVTRSTDAASGAIRWGSQHVFRTYRVPVIWPSTARQRSAGTVLRRTDLEERRAGGARYSVARSASTQGTKDDKVAPLSEDPTKGDPSAPAQAQAGPQTTMENGETTQGRSSQPEPSCEMSFKYLLLNSFVVMTAWLVQARAAAQKAMQSEQAHYSHGQEQTAPVTQSCSSSMSCGAQVLKYLITVIPTVQWVLFACWAVIVYGNHAYVRTNRHFTLGCLDVVVCAQIAFAILGWAAGYIARRTKWYNAESGVYSWK